MNPRLQPAKVLIDRGSLSVGVFHSASDRGISVQIEKNGQFVQLSVAELCDISEAVSEHLAWRRQRIGIQ
ncbi:MAG TPA: hypothetical protein VE998_04810 [Terriglobales bacterium]|nr:hypothetical protein [Terriglobales bacterium]